jgi:hypothetical protein
MTASELILYIKDGIEQFEESNKCKILDLEYKPQINMIDEFGTRIRTLGEVKFKVGGVI